MDMIPAENCDFQAGQRSVELVRPTMKALPSFSGRAVNPPDTTDDGQARTRWFFSGVPAAALERRETSLPPCFYFREDPALPWLGSWTRVRYPATPGLLPMQSASGHARCDRVAPTRSDPVPGGWRKDGVYISRSLRQYPVAGAGQRLAAATPLRAAPITTNMLVFLKHQRSFRVTMVNMASRMAMIQNRTTILGSAQPFFSKWWCRGAIRKKSLTGSGALAGIFEISGLKYHRKGPLPPKTPHRMGSRSSLCTIKATAAIAPPKSQRPGVTHEYLGRVGVVPQKSETGPNQGRKKKMVSSPVPGR